MGMRIVARGISMSKPRPGRVNGQDACRRQVGSWTYDMFRTREEVRPQASHLMMIGGR